MPYLVLALGLLMAAIGLSAISFGYPIVQVERGWSSVIAGATMLTGGLVTVALGLVFQSLVGLKKALLRQGNLVPEASHERPGFDPAMGDAPLLTPALVPVAPPLGSVLAPEVVEDASHDGRFEAPMPREHRTKIDEMALFEATIHDPPADAEPEAHHPPAPEPAAHELPPYEPPLHEAPSDQAPAHEPLAEAMPPAPTEPAPVETFAPPTAHEPSHPTPLPSDGDWLDRAFSDLDHDLAGSRAPSVAHVPVEPDPVHETAIPEPPPTAPHHAEPVEDHVALSSASPAHDPATDVALAERPATSDVIGRYEADGTAYTMYADGSIEAQSEAGLYRFASMAELKAFIEG